MDEAHSEETHEMSPSLLEIVEQDLKSCQKSVVRVIIYVLELIEDSQRMDFLIQLPLAFEAYFINISELKNETGSDEDDEQHDDIDACLDRYGLLEDDAMEEWSDFLKLKLVEMFEMTERFDIQVTWSDRQRDMEVTETSYVSGNSPPLWPTFTIPTSQGAVMVPAPQLRGLASTTSTLDAQFEADLCRIRTMLARNNL